MPALPGVPSHVMGLEFPNPVGLAAVLDKTGSTSTPLRSWLSVSCEVGTVTPRPQPGNPVPRMFRLGSSRHHQSHGFQQRRCRTPCCQRRASAVSRHSGITIEKTSTHRSNARGGLRVLHA